MKKLIILTTSFIFLMIFVLPFALSLLIKMIPNNDQPGYDISNKRAIYREFIIQQEFQAQENGLTAIGFSLGNPNLKNKKDIILDLKDTNGNTIRKTTINGANIQDGDFVKIVFAPIPDSKNIKYIFTLSSPEAGPEEIINVSISTAKTPWIGNAVYGKEVIENGLPIVSYFKPASRWKVAQTIFTDWIKKIF